MAHDIQNTQAFVATTIDNDGNPIWTWEMPINFDWEYLSLEPVSTRHAVAYAQPDSETPLTVTTLDLQTGTEVVSREITEVNVAYTPAVVNEDYILLQHEEYTPGFSEWKFFLLDVKTLNTREITGVDFSNYRDVYVLPDFGVSVTNNSTRGAPLLIVTYSTRETLEDFSSKYGLHTIAVDLNTAEVVWKLDHSDLYESFDTYYFEQRDGTNMRMYIEEWEEGEYYKVHVIDLEDGNLIESVNLTAFATVPSLERIGIQVPHLNGFLVLNSVSASGAFVSADGVVTDIAPNATLADLFQDLSNQGLNTHLPVHDADGTTFIWSVNVPSADN